MHHSLLIPEIVWNVCSQLSEVEFEQSGAGPETTRSQLLALAQTCRQFQQPALGNLWKTINGIQCIIECAGQDLWKIAKNRDSLRLTRPISPADIGTMKKYGSLVRHFRSWYDGPLDVWKAVQRALEESNQTPLFPNMSTIYLSGNLMDFAVLFGTHNLKFFSVSSEPMPNPSSLVDFSVRSQNLASLELRLNKPADRQAAVEAIRNWRNLIDFRSTIVTPEVLQALSLCKGVQRICFEGASKRPLILTDADPTMFQALQDISVNFYQLSDASRFFQSLPATGNLKKFLMYVEDDKADVPGNRLEKIMHTLHEGRPATEKDWLNLLQALEKHSHSLTEFRVQDRAVYNISSDVTLSNEPFSILATHFAALSHIQITYSGSYGITDEDMGTFTKALPLLEEFRLDTAPRFRDWKKHTINTTVDSLVSFAQNCPLLSNFCFIFDAAEFRVPKYSEDSGQGLNLDLLEVSMSLSPIMNERPRVTRLAKFLLRIFPNLEGLDWEMHGKVRLTALDLESQYAESWEEVDNKIREIREQKVSG